jgi:hypothetical protein
MVGVPVQNGAGVRSVSPQSVCAGDEAVISLRVNAPGKDQKLLAFSGDTVIAEKALDHTSPAEMLRIKLPVQEEDCRGIRVEVV